jgi:hypothetical protein
LEPKPLLSATNDILPVDPTVSVWEDVASDGYQLTMEEVHLVGDEIWVLSRLLAIENVLLFASIYCEFDLSRSLSEQIGSFDATELTAEVSVRLA